MKGIFAAALWAGFASLTVAQTFTAPLKRHYDPESVSFTRRSLLNKRQTAVASERLNNIGQAFYVIEVQVGTPAQKFDVLLDTGSPTFWLPDIPCTTGCPSGFFDPAASSSFKSLNTSFQITYGSGAANGTYGTDTVTVGGLTVTDQIFGVANSTEGTIIIQNGTSQVMLGIMGLSYPSLQYFGGYSGDVNFVFNLVNRKVISEPIFSLYLDSQYNVGYSGEITFGGVDTSKYTGDLVYAPVLPFTSSDTNASVELYWAVAGIGAKTSKGYRASFTNIAAFVLDTGTLLTYLPMTLAQDLVDSVVGTAVPFNTTYGVYMVPCSLASSNATISLGVASSFTDANATPVELVVGMNELVLPMDADNIAQSTSCAFAIVPMTPELGLVDNIFILGETILRSLYTVYDMGQNRVGFAPAKLTTGSSVTTSGTPVSPGAPSATPSKESAAISNKPTMGATAVVTMSLLLLAALAF